MRSQKDAKFSDLCDRVGRGEITEEDKKFLLSRVKDCPDEMNNEKFKDGTLSIIVTTNNHRNFVNKQKLHDLLPNQTEYSCNSIDRVANMPQKHFPNKLIKLIDSFF